MSVIKTKTPTTKKVFPVTVKATDSFTNKEFFVKGTATIFEYRDFSKMVFAKVKTPFGLGTLKLSYIPTLGWRRDAVEMPCCHVRVHWSDIGDALAGALAA